MSSKLTFHAMWLECFEERGRHEIWRDEFLRRATDTALSEQDRADAGKMAQVRARKADIYEALMRLLAHVDADTVLKNRLRALKAADREALQELMRQIADEDASAESEGPAEVDAPPTAPPTAAVAELDADGWPVGA